MENYRIEAENFLSAPEDDEDQLTWKDKFYLFLIPWRKKQKKKIEVDDNSENDKL